MGPRRVAPAAVVRGQGVVGRAEVGGRNDDGGTPLDAPLPVVDALDLEAGPADDAAVEYRRAHCRRLHPVALAVEVPVPARATCNKAKRITTNIISSKIC